MTGGAVAQAGTISRAGFIPGIIQFRTPGLGFRAGIFISLQHAVFLFLIRKCSQ